MPRKNEQETRQEQADDQSQTKGSEPMGSSSSQGAVLVVGIGASAGGLKAFESFFDRMPADNNLAFVLIQHLGEERASLLAELVSRHTGMTVSEATDGEQVRPNCVYTIPQARKWRSSTEDFTSWIGPSQRGFIFPLTGSFAPWRLI